MNLPRRDDSGQQGRQEGGKERDDSCNQLVETGFPMKIGQNFEMHPNHHFLQLQASSERQSLQGNSFGNFQQIQNHDNKKEEHELSKDTSAYKTKQYLEKREMKSNSTYMGTEDVKNKWEGTQDLRKAYEEGWFKGIRLNQNERLKNAFKILEQALETNERKRIAMNATVKALQKTYFYVQSIRLLHGLWSMGITYASQFFDPSRLDDWSELWEIYFYLLAVQIVAFIIGTLITLYWRISDQESYYELSYNHENKSNNSEMTEQLRKQHFAKQFHLSQQTKSFQKQLDGQVVQHGQGAGLGGTQYHGFRHSSDFEVLPYATLDFHPIKIGDITTRGLSQSNTQHGQEHQQINHAQSFEKESIQHNILSLPKGKPLRHSISYPFQQLQDTSRPLADHSDFNNLGNPPVIPSNRTKRIDNGTQQNISQTDNIHSSFPIPTLPINQSNISAIQQDSSPMHNISSIQQSNNNINQNQNVSAVHEQQNISVGSPNQRLEPSPSNIQIQNISNQPLDNPAQLTQFPSVKTRKSLNNNLAVQRKKTLTKREFFCECCINIPKLISSFFIGVFIYRCDIVLIILCGTELCFLVELAVQSNSVFKNRLIISDFSIRIALVIIGYVVLLRKLKFLILVAIALILYTPLRIQMKDAISENISAAVQFSVSLSIMMILISITRFYFITALSKAYTSSIDAYRDITTELSARIIEKMPFAEFLQITKSVGRLHKKISPFFEESSMENASLKKNKSSSKQSSDEMGQFKSSKGDKEIKDQVIEDRGESGSELNKSESANDHHLKLIADIAEGFDKCYIVLDEKHNILKQNETFQELMGFSVIKFVSLILGQNSDELEFISEKKMIDEEWNPMKYSEFAKVKYKKKGEKRHKSQKINKNNRKQKQIKEEDQEKQEQSDQQVKSSGSLREQTNKQENQQKSPKKDKIKGKEKTTSSVPAQNTTVQKLDLPKKKTLDINQENDTINKVFQEQGQKYINTYKPEQKTLDNIDLSPQNYPALSNYSTLQPQNLPQQFLLHHHHHNPRHSSPQSSLPPIHRDSFGSSRVLKESSFSQLRRSKNTQQLLEQDDEIEEKKEQASRKSSNKSQNEEGSGKKDENSTLLQKQINKIIRQHKKHNSIDGMCKTFNLRVSGTQSFLAVTLQPLIISQKLYFLLLIAPKNLAHSNALLIESLHEISTTVRGMANTFFGQFHSAQHALKQAKKHAKPEFTKSFLDPLVMLSSIALAKLPIFLQLIHPKMPFPVISGSKRIASFLEQEVVSIFKSQEAAKGITIEVKMDDEKRNTQLVSDFQKIKFILVVIIEVLLQHALPGSKIILGKRNGQEAESVELFISLIIQGENAVSVWSRIELFFESEMESTESLVKEKLNEAQQRRSSRFPSTSASTNNNNNYNNIYTNTSNFNSQFLKNYSSLIQMQIPNIQTFDEADKQTTLTRTSFKGQSPREPCLTQYQQSDEENCLEWEEKSQIQLADELSRQIRSISINNQPSKHISKGLEWLKEIDSFTVKFDVCNINKSDEFQSLQSDEFLLEELESLEGLPYNDSMDFHRLPVPHTLSELGVSQWKKPDERSYGNNKKDESKLLVSKSIGVGSQKASYSNIFEGGGSPSGGNQQLKRSARFLQAIDNQIVDSTGKLNQSIPAFLKYENDAINNNNNNTIHNNTTSNISKDGLWNVREAKQGSILGQDQLNHYSSTVLFVDTCGFYHNQFNKAIQYLQQLSAAATASGISTPVQIIRCESAYSSKEAIRLVQRAFTNMRAQFAYIVVDASLVVQFARELHRFYSLNVLPMQSVVILSGNAVCVDVFQNAHILQKPISIESIAKSPIARLFSSHDSNNNSMTAHSLINENHHYP